MGLVLLLQKLRFVVFGNVVPALKGVSLIAPAGNGSSRRILRVCLCRNADFAWSAAVVLGMESPKVPFPGLRGSGLPRRWHQVVPQTWCDVLGSGCWVPEPLTSASVTDDKIEGFQGFEDTDGQISRPGISGRSHPTAVLVAAFALPPDEASARFFWHGKGLRKGCNVASTHHWGRPTSQARCMG